MLLVLAFVTFVSFTNAAKLVANVNYKCPAGYILAVLSKESDRVNMACRQPNFGAVAGPCADIAGSSCGPNQFLSGIVKTDSSGFTATCCSFSAPEGHDYNDNCDPNHVKPKNMPSTPWPLTKEPNVGPVVPPVPRPNKPSGQGQGPPKPAVGPPKPQEPKIIDTLLTEEVGASTMGDPPVKGMTPTATGWKVDFCRPEVKKHEDNEQPEVVPPVASIDGQTLDDIDKDKVINLGTCSDSAMCAAKCSEVAGENLQNSRCVDGACYCLLSQIPDSLKAFKANFGGGHCFSADSTVITPEGPMRMEQLKVGHQVMVMNEATGQMVFEPVDSFIHRRNDIHTKFIDISTDAGTGMSLTPGHLVPISDCSNGVSLTLKYASEAQLGECVLAQVDGQLTPTKIVGLKESMKTGIYAPLTRSGNLLVDNTVASCYSNHESFYLQNTFYRMFMMLQQMVFGVSGTLEPVDVPPVLHLFGSMTDSIKV